MIRTDTVRRLVECALVWGKSCFPFLEKWVGGRKLSDEQKIQCFNSISLYLVLASAIIVWFCLSEACKFIIFELAHERFSTHISISISISLNRVTIYYLNVLNQGGRGFLQSIWRNCGTSSSNVVKEQYNSSYPSYLNYLETTEYGKQSLVAKLYKTFDEFDSTLCSSCVKYEGYIKPPYTGLFNLMVNAYDHGELWFSQCTNNCSESDLVWLFYLLLW